MGRTKVWLLAAVAVLALGALWLWHARAVAQSECIWNCVPTSTCQGTPTVFCSGCAQGMDTCTPQEGKWTWTGVEVFATEPGNKKVTWRLVHCGTHYPCIATNWGERVCVWLLGVCSPVVADPVPCISCEVSQEGIPYWAATAICETCSGSGN